MEPIYAQGQNQLSHAKIANDDLAKLDRFLRFVSLQRHKADAERKMITEIVREIGEKLQQKYFNQVQCEVNKTHARIENVGSSGQRTEIGACSDYDYNIYLKFPRPQEWKNLAAVHIYQDLLLHLPKSYVCSPENAYEGSHKVKKDLAKCVAAANYDISYSRSRQCATQRGVGLNGTYSPYCRPCPVFEHNGRFSKIVGSSVTHLLPINQRGTKASSSTMLQPKCVLDSNRFRIVSVKVSGEFHLGAAVKMEVLFSHRKTVSVDLVPVFEIYAWPVPQPQVESVLENPVADHKWPKRNTGDRHQQELLNLIKNEIVLCPGKEFGAFDFGMAHGHKQLINHLNARYGAGHTMEKELFRIMKGLSYLYWRSSGIKLKSYIMLTIFCYEREKFNDNSFWDPKWAMERLKGLIGSLYGAVCQKFLKPYIEPSLDHAGNPRNLLEFLRKRPINDPEYLELLTKLDISRKYPGLVMDILMRIA